MSDSDFDTGSELSDLDFLNVSVEEYEASALAGLGSRSVVYNDGSGGVVGRTGGIRGPGTRDGNESDTSSWSFAGGSERESWDVLAFKERAWELLPPPPLLSTNLSEGLEAIEIITVKLQLVILATSCYRQIVHTFSTPQRSPFLVPSP
jgi:hypothetical protein